MYVFVYFSAFFSFMQQIQLELFVLTKAKTKQMQKNSNKSRYKGNGETVASFASLFVCVLVLRTHTQWPGLIILRNSIMGKPIFRFDLIFAAICRFVLLFF